MPRGVLDLSPLRPWAALLQRMSAACRPAGNNGGAPIAVISKAPKDEQIIATGSGSTGNVAGEIQTRVTDQGSASISSPRNIPSWDARSASTAVADLGSRIYVHAGLADMAEGVGRTASALSSLYPVRPERSVRRSVSQNPTSLGC